jgi:carbon monoxide dehydrogenase subunit G
MNISGEITVPAPRAHVFDRLKDAFFFTSCMDGVRNLTAIDATHYEAVLETKVAYMKFCFAVAVEVTRVSPPDIIEAKIEGHPLGIVGRMTATSATQLAETNGQTILRYVIDATLTGKLGSIGQRVIIFKAKEMHKTFAERLLAAFTAGIRAAQ